MAKTVLCVLHMIYDLLIRIGKKENEGTKNYTRGTDEYAYVYESVYVGALQWTDVWLFLSITYNANNYTYVLPTR